ncbi:MAG TPA: cytochrome b/b6 domain-containing protein [Verrucomicrobiae bacterium]|nr:cytochrome b/b6 domain-containing protein [Verrucomicrobiae bacterium]
MENHMSYTRTAISLHWLLALLIFSGWGLGFYMHELPTSPQKLQYYSWHKWMGVTVFLLVLVRASWRLFNVPPPLPHTVPPWQVSASRVSHVVLYLLMLALPLSGWLMSSAKGFQTVYFGVLPIPDLLQKDKDLGELLAYVHWLLAFALAWLVALHVAAALKHHFLDKDGVLRRMLPALLPILVIGPLLGAAAGNVNTARSELTATFRQMNVPVEARFTAFRGSVTFDPAAAGKAAASLEVDTASFDIGEDEYNAEARGKEWLDAAAHPRATFVSDKVVSTGRDQHTASGTFTLKGKAMPLSVPFTLRRKDGLRTYDGQFSISRKDYAIGGKAWDGVLEDAVVVRFRIVTPDP